MSVPICKAIGCTLPSECLVMVAHAAEAPWQDLPKLELGPEAVVHMCKCAAPVLEDCRGIVGAAQVSESMLKVSRPQIPELGEEGLQGIASQLWSPFAVHRARVEHGHLPLGKSLETVLRAGNPAMAS